MVRGRLGRAGATTWSYVQLTKPRVIELLLVTTLPAMILAAGEFPPVLLVIEVLVGGALAAGGANTINCWIERDRDHLMHRTAHRPLPMGAIALAARSCSGWCSRRSHSRCCGRR